MVLMSSPWLTVAKSTGQPKLRLVCFPHSGGGPSAFSAWQETLGDDIEVVAVSAPGRERRVLEQPISSLHRLVDDIADALNSSRILEDTPCAFFGHSFGAIVALEVARKLQAMRQEGAPGPLKLLVSAHVPPANAVDARLAVDWAALSDEELVREVSRWNFLPAEVAGDAALRQAVLPALRADLSMYQSYEPEAGRPPLDLPVAVFHGRNDVSINPELLSGWAIESAACLSGPHFFEGGHFFIEEQRTEVLTVVAGELKQALTQLPPSLHSCCGAPVQWPMPEGLICVQDEVRMRCAEFPERVALVDEDGQEVTYA
jgi:medium-chain acyl-[acyl-carrier-protein] hydrolase